MAKSRVVAVAGAVVLLLVGCAHHSTADVPSTSKPKTGPAVAALAAAPVRSTWRSVGAAPDARLRQPGSTPSLRGLEQETSFWTARDDIDDEMSWITAHPPVGYRYSTTSDGGGPEGAEPRTVSFDKIQPADELPKVDIVYTLFALDDVETGIRADAQASSNPAYN